MKVNSISSANFQGIKIKNSSFKDSKNLALFLEINCFDVAGYRRFFTQKNTTEAKHKCLQYVRNNYDFAENECGIVLFPWARELWVIAQPRVEQELLPIIKDFTGNAVINLKI